MCENVGKSEQKRKKDVYLHCRVAPAAFLDLFTSNLNRDFARMTVVPVGR